MIDVSQNLLLIRLRCFLGQKLYGVAEKIWYG